MIQKESGKIIAMFSPRVGQTKTTTALELAARLQNSLVVDWQEQTTLRTAQQRLKSAKARNQTYSFPISNGNTNIAEALKAHDYVLLDTEGALPEKKSSQLDVADMVIVPVGTDALSFEACHEAISQGKNLNIFILFTQVKDFEELAKRQGELIRWGVQYLDTYIPYSKEIPPLSEKGLLTKHDSSMGVFEVAKAYDGLANEIHGLLNG